MCEHRPTAQSRDRWSRPHARGYASAATAFFVLAAIVASAAAQQPPEKEPEKVREILVPFSDLRVILENQPRRVLLSRAEYDALVKKAKKSPESHAPLPAVLASAEYKITTDGQQARFSGTLEIDVLEDGLHALPLDIGGVGLLAARLDDRDAPIGRGADGRLSLLVEGRGPHRLTLEMVGPLETTSAQQVLNFRLPQGAAGRMFLTVPGDVELKTGAAVVSRRLDEAASVTRFEVLPPAGQATILLSLNSHLQRKEQIVAAREVLVDEITEACERLHASVTMVVLHRAVDRFRFVVPEGFELTEISSPLLARWDVSEEAGRKVANLRLREQTVEPVVLSIAAVRTRGLSQFRAPGAAGSHENGTVPLGKAPAWHFPRLEMLDVVSQVAILGLMVQERWKAESLASENLLAIDASVLARAAPATLLRREPDAAAVRAVAAYYAPQAAYSLSALFERPRPAITVTSGILLVLAEKGCEVRGGLTLLAETEKQFSFDLSVPPGWQVTSVTGPNGQPLQMDILPSPGTDRRLAGRGVGGEGQSLPSLLAGEGPGVRGKGRGDAETRGRGEAEKGGKGEREKAGRGEAGRIRVRLAQGIEPGRPYAVRFTAVSTPAGWLGDWQTRPAEFPVFAVAGAASDEGAIAVVAQDDIDVRPDRLEHLVPLTEPEKAKYGLAGVPTGLAYRYEAPGYAATLAVERTRPRLTARTFSFFQIRPEGLAAHYELIYRVDDAKTRRLALLLPASTPEAIKIWGLGDLVVKEYTHEPAGKSRRWNVLLGEARRDELRLAVEFQSPLPSPSGRGAGGEGAREGRGDAETRGHGEGEKGRKGEGEKGGDGDAGRVSPLPPGEGQGVRGSSENAPFLLRDYPLPLVSAGDVTYQSGNVAVEGSPELDIQIHTEARRADVGQLAAAAYQPGRRLLGNYSFLGPPPGDVDIDISRHPAYDLAPAIIQRAELLTIVGADGTNQTQADFHLRTKALFVEIQLPEGAQLWSVALDGTPLKPQQTEGSLLVSLPASGQGAGSREQGAGTHDLRMVYAAGGRGDAERRGRGDAGANPPSPLAGEGSGVRVEKSPRPLGEAPASGYPGVRALGMAARLHLPAPRLAFRAARDAEAVDLPLVDLVWKLRVPSGYEVVRQRGTLVGGDLNRPIPAPAVVAAVAFGLGGGYQSSYGFGCAAPMAAKHAEQVGMALHGYESTQRKAPSGGSGFAGQDYVDYRRQAAKEEARPEVKAEPKADESKSADVPDRELDDAMRVAVKGGNKPSSAVHSQSLLEKMHGREALSEREEKQEAFVQTMTAGEKAPPAPADTPPIVYPPEDAWKELTARRKEKYSGAELAARAPEAKPAEKPAEPNAPTFIGGEFATGKVYPAADLVIPVRKLSGVRSLNIALDATPAAGEQMLTFQSLGGEPLLDVTLAHRERFDALAWALGLGLGLWGIAITRRPVRQKVCLVLGAALVGAALPFVWDNVAVAWLANAVFYAASLLVPYYLLAGAVRWVAGKMAGLPGSPRRQSGGFSTTAVPLLVAVAACGFACSARADEPAQQHVVVEEDRTPVAVPDDAVLLPYDPQSKTGIREAEQLLVPYARYVELWNRAYPDKKIESRPAEWPYALGGASYSCALEGDEALRITGQVSLDVFGDGYVSVPLGVRGGVLARAELDGKPARLGVVRAEQGAGSGEQGGPVLVLHVSGKGRHTLDLEVRLHLTRQGGWRLAQGVLPAAPASALAIRVPEARTEVRLGQAADRRSRQTQEAGEMLRTALGPGGELAIQWRPKIAEAQVDRGLTVESLGTFEVQEDGLRLAWRLSLAFRRAEREAFTLLVPGDYLVERLSGRNVRGWEVRRGGDTQAVDVSLLKAAKDAEEMTLYLSRGWKPPAREPATLDVPAVGVRDAALSSGQITILRSPMLDVRTLEQVGLARIDLVESRPADPDRPATQESVLLPQPVESYRFATMPFRLRLSAAAAAARATADVQTLVKAAEYQPTLETRVLYHIQDRPLYRLRLVLPAGLSREQVILGCPHQWAIAQEAKRRVLVVDLAEGQQGDLPLVLTGVLSPPDAARAFPAPRVEVLDVERQQGDVVVQADPAFDVAARELVQCEEQPLGQVFGWLQPEQRPAARLALRYLRPGYAAALRLVPRRPEVACETITNVRVTDRAVETTIFLNYTIRQAGIRQLSFTLPAWMADARISVPMLRQKTIKRLPASQPDNGKAPGLHPGDNAEPLIRVTLELQDDVIDTLRVLLQHDRMLSPQACVAPVPAVEDVRNASEAFKVRVDRQYVTLEKAARDEVVEDPSPGLEPLSRQQKQWQALAALPGRPQCPAAATGLPPGPPRRRRDRRGADRAGANHARARRQRGVPRADQVQPGQHHRAISQGRAARRGRAVDRLRGRRAGQAGPTGGLSQFSRAIVRRQQ